MNTPIYPISEAPQVLNASMLTIVLLVEPGLLEWKALRGKWGCKRARSGCGLDKLSFAIARLILILVDS